MNRRMAGQELKKEKIGGMLDDEDKNEVTGEENQEQVQVQVQVQVHEIKIDEVIDGVKDQEEVKDGGQEDAKVKAQMEDSVKDRTMAQEMEAGACSEAPEKPDKPDKPPKVFMFGSTDFRERMKERDEGQ